MKKKLLAVTSSTWRQRALGTTSAISHPIHIRIQICVEQTFITRAVSSLQRQNRAFHSLQMCDINLSSSDANTSMILTLTLNHILWWIYWKCWPGHQTMKRKRKTVISVLVSYLGGVVDGPWREAIEREASKNNIIFPNIENRFISFCWLPPIETEPHLPPLPLRRKQIEFSFRQVLSVICSLVARPHTYHTRTNQTPTCSYFWPHLNVKSSRIEANAPGTVATRSLLVVNTQQK